MFYTSYYSRSYAFFRRDSFNPEFEKKHTSDVITFKSLREFDIFVCLMKTQCSNKYLFKQAAKIKTEITYYVPTV